MEFFIYRFNFRKNDITNKSELTLDTKGVKGLIRASNLRSPRSLAALGRRLQGRIN